MRLHQQTPDCADFDVTLEGGTGPSFRLLLPEWLRGEGIEYQGLLHVIPGTWRVQDRVVEGCFAAGEQIKISVRLEPGAGDILIELAVCNQGAQKIADVWANVCASVNHLPGDPGWSNDRFLPSVPLDRTVQGRYWYEKVAPRGLRALTAKGWVNMHPHPDRPDADQVPLYNFAPSAGTGARACAVPSAEGQEYCFQAWDAPCRYCAPSPGNACMHLEPFVAEVVEPGAVARIRGLAGIHVGDDDSLVEKIGQFLETCPLSGP